MSNTSPQDENETEASLSPDLRAQLRATSGQHDENDTLPALTSEMREQLQAALKTLKIDSRELNLETVSAAGNALFKNHTTVLFALIDRDVLLPIHVADRVILGRPDASASEKMDIDLTPYGGRDYGVSRRHAALYRTPHTVSLVDLNSTNGTYLNGVKLIPHQPRLLREGDEVRLAKMRFHISFDK
ncbi:MAG: FHA domain-containing protein [Chloroflexota bacterium]